MKLYIQLIQAMREMCETQKETVGDRARHMASDPNTSLLAHDILIEMMCERLEKLEAENAVLRKRLEGHIQDYSSNARGLPRAH